MDKATHTMIENIYKNTGYPLDYWIEVVKKQNFEKHGEIIKFLKEQYQFSHGFANLIAHKSKETSTSLSESIEEIINSHYTNKEHLKPIYDLLMEHILSFGNDIEISPKKTYVSLRRKKQFATLNPATKTRFEIGINLKGITPQGKLEAEKPNAMCSHKIKIEKIEDINDEVIHWIKIAFDNAG